ncbi:CHAT domain-containing protein [Mycena pura]|uniref:CHAT domain-containing protein n=1 Tax=Mycena pura TaxID=153505 RepID=A0AAD6URA9_9AGAR|nr:CHAT domain-containing protein [Mycena pura]
MQLGQAFQSRYNKSGNLDDLQAAVQAIQAVVDLTPEGHPDKAGRLQKLAVSIIHRYRRLGNLQDLEAALQYFQEAVKLTPEDHSNKAGRLQSLAVSFTERYQRLGNLQDLEAALQYDQEAVKLTPEDHSDKAGRLYNLAVSFTDRYRRLGNLQDLEAALQYNQEAVKLTPEDHSKEAGRLQNLAVSFTDRYQRLGNLQDLEAALQYKQEAVKLTPEDHSDKAGRLQSLAVSLTDRYQRLGNLQDLEAALQYKQEAVKLTPEDHSRKAGRLQSLAVSFTDRYRRLGNLQDLEAALQYNQEAVKLTPEDHSRKAGRLQSLAVSFTDRYRRLGNLQDLEAALQYKQEAVKLTPEDHSGKAGRLQNLAVSFTDRYRRLGNLQDLEAALQYKQEAVKLTPEDHSDKAGRLQNLAVSLTDRYRRLGNLQDLEAALQYFQEAVKLTPEDHSRKAGRLQSLAISFTDRYWRLGNLQDLEAALQYNQEAVKLTPEDHSDKAGRLQNLAVSFTDRYQRLGNLQDLEAALQYNQEAVKLTPEDHSDKAGRLQSLAVSLADHYRRFQNPRDLQDIHKYYRLSFQIISSTPESSWQAALHWGTFAAQFSPTYCITAYVAAFSLLPELLWIGHSISVRHNLLHTLDISKATSTAVKTCINLSPLTSTVEILEQGLATTFQQMLQLKTAVDGLPDEQAQKFKELSMKLYTEGSDDSMNIVNQRNDLIKEIRKQPGFQFFLLPKAYSALCQAAQQGPVVILNSHKQSCDGIIILNPTSDPVHVAFSNVTLDLLHSHSVVLKGLCGHRVRGQSASSRLFGYKEGLLSSKEKFANMLDWLWTHIVELVYKTLKSHGIYGGRLWWLPTGAFTGLPLHACPPSDHFIHSYTATLGSLLEAYNKPSRGVNKLGVVGVTQTDSEGANYLKGVGLEVESILSTVQKPYVSCLQGAQATVDGVKTQLQNCSWLHLACHGTQDLIEPTKSRLLLYEGNLELETILRMPLQNAEVVFLAACQTAMGDSELVNESFHLGGGFIAAGFRGAIGTLWSMQDQDGPLVAKAVYSYLFRNGSQPQATDAAEALHLAVKELRARNLSYEHWVPFIHMGI